MTIKCRSIQFCNQTIQNRLVPYYVFNKEVNLDLYDETAYSMTTMNEHIYYAYIVTTDPFTKLNVWYFIYPTLLLRIHSPN